MTGKQSTDGEKLWREIDIRVARGDMQSEDAVRALEKLGLVSGFGSWYLSSGPYDEIGHHAGLLWILRPAAPMSVAGPRLILDLGKQNGGSRIYLPLRHRLTSRRGDRLGQPS